MVGRDKSIFWNSKYDILEIIMKSLVIYYSFEGNTRFIAETIAAQLQADLLELIPKKDLTSKGLTKFIWGGRQVVRRIKPDLQPLTKDPAAYDLLVIGTPVWAFTFAPALRSFFAQVPIKNKKIALFCTHQGIMARTLENMEKALTGNQIIAKTHFLSPVEKDKETIISQAKAWARTIFQGK
jgi:flavodoxin